jgi:hypothetical protein
MKIQTYLIPLYFNIWIRKAHQIKSLRLLSNVCDHQK